MEQRYSIDQLARMSDQEMVRRQFDARNLRWLTIVLVLFIIIPLIDTAAEMKGGKVRSEADVASTMWNCLFASFSLIGVALAHKREARRWPITAWVIAFTVIQFLWLHYPLHEGVWVADGVFALLFSRFRLEERLALALNGFYFLTMSVAAYLAPIAEERAPMNAVAYLLVALMIAFAAARQISGARRARKEILEEWREPFQNAREQVRMRDELRYARELQLSMLPEEPPRLDWIDVAGVSLPAAEVGGDYYDFCATEGRLTIIACDVAGHGMASGLVLASMRGGFTVLRRTMTDPAAVLEQLHDVVSASSRTRMLATAAVVMIDRNAMRATIASSGHPPLVFRRDGHAATIELHSPPLGVRLPLAIAEATRELVAGDVLVLHSDGVYETRNAAGETYGFERLERIVAVQPDGTNANAIRDAIVHDVETFRGGAAQEDDLTVVVARLLA